MGGHLSPKSEQENKNHARRNTSKFISKPNFSNSSTTKTSQIDVKYNYDWKIIIKLMFLLSQHSCKWISNRLITYPLGAKSSQAKSLLSQEILSVHIWNISTPTRLTLMMSVRTEKHQRREYAIKWRQI